MTPHVLRHSLAGLAADLGYEPTIASLLGHKTHSITSGNVHSADAWLLAAADAVADATTKLMASDQ
jgi:integrase